MKKFILLLLLSSSYLYAGPREDAQNIITRFSSETSLEVRLDLISKTFLNLPYGKGGPLGEGQEGNYDQDPLYRFDTFDCTTYVETIMALALSRDVNEFENNLDKIRYENGEIEFLKRNHFTDLQWIPNNISNGMLTEINFLLMPESQIKIATALINFPAWIKSLKVTDLILPLASLSEKEEVLKKLHQEAEFYSPKEARVPYIEIKKILATPGLLSKIPSGSIVNFVRPNWDLTETAGTHQNISHQGFLFKKGKVLYLRHASTSGKVEELPFLTYLKKFQNHPTLKGIHLMKMGN